MTPSPRTSGAKSTAPVAASRGRDVARVELPQGPGVGARSVIRQMGRLARDLPDRVGVVVVSVTSVDDVTVDLMTGIAISRRLMAVQGRHLVLCVPGVPPPSGAAALLATMPYILSPKPGTQA